MEIGEWEYGAKGKGNEGGKTYIGNVVVRRVIIIIIIVIVMRNEII
jgi:hypothetical protein